jgi:hypothetical protein
MISVKLMAEYECFPIWIGPLEDIENIPADSLEVSRELTSDINEWADSYEATYCPDDPISSGFKDVDSERAFAETGVSLATRLQEELGNG